MRIVDLFMRHEVTYKVDDLAIAEAVYVMQGQGFSRREIVNRLVGLLERVEIVVNRDLLERIFPIYLKYPKLSFSDCYLAAKTALDEAEPLWTFDQDLAKELGTAKLVK